MSTEIDEDDVIGPTIWEAAAEEEIQENFWCVGPPRAILILSQTSERTMSAPRTSDAYPTRIPRAHRPSPASSTRTGSITAARTATRARVTPSSTTSRTSPFATVRQSAERGVGTRTGCGQRRSEEIGGTRWGDVSTGYFIYELYQIRSCSQNTDVFARPSASRVHDPNGNTWVD